ncbi:hypothetical protein ACLB2K_017641 [Fragaria x ananassa]
MVSSPQVLTRESRGDEGDVQETCWQEEKFNVALARQSALGWGLSRGGHPRLIGDCREVACQSALDMGLWLYGEAVDWGLSQVLTTQFHLGSSVASPGSIFILAGQSNMAGRGGVSGGKWDGNVPPECAPNPSILKLNALLVWEEAHEPLHADIDVGKMCGVGPGMPFANEVLRAKGGVLGLVPCAVGGTSIGQWAQGTQLYTQMVRRASESVKAGGTIRAVLWYQGESDTVNRADAEAYKANFERLVTALRSDLQNPNLPVI